MDRTDLKGKQPKDLQQASSLMLRARYGREAVTVGTLAVTLRHDDKVIQLLPALRD